MAREGLLGERGSDAFDCHRQSADDQIVRKAQDSITFAAEPTIPRGVPECGLLRLMRPAIRIDNDLLCQANEVGEIRTDRRLPPKLVAVEPVVARRAPQHRFRLRHIATERPRKLARGQAKLRRLLHVQRIAQSTPRPPSPRQRGRGREATDGVRQASPAVWQLTPIDAQAVNHLDNVPYPIRPAGHLPRRSRRRARAWQARSFGSFAHHEIDGAVGGVSDVSLSWVRD